MAQRKNDRFDGYTINVYLDEDDDWLAHFVEMPEVSAFSSTPELALDELAQAWRGVRLSYEKRGETAPIAPSRKRYSGQFNVRIDKRLHRTLAVEAAKAGVSLNAMVAQKLTLGATIKST
ncbi:MAG: type II toxin-antitoxin system HicB family antitoxin [Burkholderiales bacterium]